jgi:hypothetical protein
MCSARAGFFVWKEITYLCFLISFLGSVRMIHPWIGTTFCCCYQARNWQISVRVRCVCCRNTYQSDFRLVPPLGHPLRARASNLVNSICPHPNFRARRKGKKRWRDLAGPCPLHRRHMHFGTPAVVLENAAGGSLRACSDQCP